MKKVVKNYINKNSEKITQGVKKLRKYKALKIGKRRCQYQT